MICRAALVQTRTPSEPRAALAHLEPLIRQGAAEGAAMILTPEGSNLLQRDRDRFAGLARTMEEDLVVQGVRSLASELKIEILLGSALVRREGGGFANRSLLISASGAVTAAYDKIHMFDVDLPDGQTIRESATYEPGRAAVLADSVLGRLGMTICYDLRFPGLFRALAAAGAEVLAVPSAFTRKTGEAHWEPLLRARAIENSAFVLAPAQGGAHEDGRVTWGRTLAVSPWGEVIGRLETDDPGVLVVELDLSAVAAARRAIPSLANGRAFDPPALRPRADAAA